MPVMPIEHHRQSLKLIDAARRDEQKVAEQRASYQPMSQFELIDGHLTVIDTSRYDFWWGFRRVLRKLT